MTYHSCPTASYNDNDEAMSNQKNILEKIKSIDLIISELYRLRKNIYGPDCLHERVGEVKFSHAEIHNSRWCKRCLHQEKESEGYTELIDESWRHVDSFNANNYKSKYV